jgi:hypothetical protein
VGLVEIGILGVAGYEGAGMTKVDEKARPLTPHENAMMDKGW